LPPSPGGFGATSPPSPGNKTPVNRSPGSGS
jgi:hypothetical protein